jgi:glycerol-3-phosphate dehydrogenase (NAD(P)+)
VAFERIGVVGGGAWGSALAQTLTVAGRDVILWAFEEATVDEINSRHTNQVFLPGVNLDERLRATAALAELADRELILMVPPAQHLRAVGGQLAPHLGARVPTMICAKGIEQTTGKLLCEVLGDVAPQLTPGVISGPSFAAEVARGLPAALTVACADPELGEEVAQAVGSQQLRTYWTRDLVGVQLGGAIKNVLAIAAGIVDGRQLGASAHAALVTRGFAELRRFAGALGADPETLTGLSGLGDLLLTCGSPQSRNMSLGRALGQGQRLEDVLGGRRAVTEGVYTARAVVEIAKVRGIDVPISEAVRSIVDDGASVDDVIAGLMRRPLRAETESMRD